MKNFLKKIIWGLFYFKKHLKRCHYESHILYKKSNVISPLLLEFTQILLINKGENFRKVTVFHRAIRHCKIHKNDYGFDLDG